MYMSVPMLQSTACRAGPTTGAHRAEVWTYTLTAKNRTMKFVKNEPVAIRKLESLYVLANLADLGDKGARIRGTPSVALWRATPCGDVGPCALRALSAACPAERLNAITLQRDNSANHNAKWQHSKSQLVNK